MGEFDGFDLDDKTEKLKVQQEGKVISTGSGEIDKKMGGGIPLGSLTLIDGHSDAGKSVLAQQMIWGSINNGFTVSIFTTENTVKSLVRQMNSLSLDILDALLLDVLRIYPVRLKGGKDSMEQMLSVLGQAIQKESTRDLIIIDSITPFVAHVPPEDAMSFFEDCKTFCNRGKTLVNIIHTYALDDGMVIRLASMCDAHIRLRIEEMGAQLLKSMEVCKIRGAGKTTGNIVAFDVEPGIGMKIIPVSKAKA